MRYIATLILKKTFTTRIINSNKKTKIAMRAKKNQKTISKGSKSKLYWNSLYILFGYWLIINVFFLALL